MAFAAALATAAVPATVELADWASIKFAAREDKCCVAATNVAAGVPAVVETAEGWFRPIPQTP